MKESEAPFIVLSDGCSQSEDTEIGSKILCHVAKKYLRHGNDVIAYETLGNNIIKDSLEIVESLSLPTTCLDATLIASFIFLDDVICNYFYGDGVLIQKKGETIYTTIIEYDNNAPYYLSYLIDKKRNQEYQTYNIKKTITTYINNEKVHEYKTNADSQTFFTDYSVDISIIASDGLLSFICEDPKERRTIKLTEFVHDILAFKNIKGEFLKRRLKKQMKTFKKNQIMHFDDLAIGAFIKGV
jgi:hypothetical protein